MCARFSGEQSCQVAALDLAQGIPGYRRNQVDSLGHLEICQASSAIRLQFLCGGGASEHYRGRDFFTVLRVWHPENRSLGYRRMLEQHGFDFHRRDFLSSAIDNLLDTSG